MTQYDLNEDAINYALQEMHCVDLFDAYLEGFDELVNEVPSTPLIWWPRLDEYLGGLRPFEYTILCGSTGLGKTTFLANLSGQLVQQRVKHFVASVETGHKDFARRMISLFVNQDINRGIIYNKDELIDIKKRSDPVFKTSKKLAYLSLYNNRIPLQKLLNDLHLAHTVLGCEVAFLDNLNFFLEITSAQNAVIEMDRVTHELIMFAKNTPMHIVMVMHPRKTDGARVESEYDIKGSSTSVQEAQNVLLLNRMSEAWYKRHDISIRRKEINPSLFRELKIAKLRRRGVNVGKKVIFRCDDSSKYHEENENYS